MIIINPLSNLSIVMSSKKAKYMDSIGNGLLSDTQKYKGKSQQAVQMREMSSRYNYVNLDEQTEPVPTLNMKKTPQREYQPRVEPPPAPMEMTAMGANRNAIRDVEGNPHEYPSFDNSYKPVPQNRPAENKGQPRQELPEYQSISRNNAQNPNKNPPPPVNAPPAPPVAPGPYYPQQPYDVYGGYNQNYYNCQGYYPQGYYAPVSAYPYYPAQPYVYSRRGQYCVPNVPHGVLRSVPVAPMSGSSITINGMRFQSQVPVQPQPQPQAPRKKFTVPDMTVTCDYCATQQAIPGTSTIFICFNCKNKVKCFPTHNIFKCDGCKSRVSYQLGTSKFIKCTKCQKVNEVPVSYEEEVEKSVMKSRIAEADKSMIERSVYEGEIPKDEVIYKEEEPRIRETPKEVKSQRERARIEHEETKDDMLLLAHHKQEGILTGIDGTINGQQEFSEISEIEPHKEEINPFCKKPRGYDD